MSKQKRYFLYTVLIVLIVASTFVFQEQLKGIYLANDQVAQSDEEKFLEAKSMAESGNAKAQYRLASYYAQGIGTPQNIVESNKWCMQAAEAGYVLAQSKLGNLYELGVSPLVQNLNRAVYWYEKAAAQNDNFAMQRLMLLYREDGGALGYNQEKFVYWAEKLHLAGDPLGTFAMAIIFKTGKGRPQDIDKATALYESAAEHGQTSGLTVLGFTFFNGEYGVPVDKSKARSYFQRASDAGDAGAKSFLAKMYISGDAGSVSYSSAGALLKDAAAAGYNNAINQLNAHKANCQSTTVLPKEWEKSCLVSAYAGDRISKFILGSRYLHKASTAEEKKAGYEWMEKSAKDKFLQAQVYLSSYNFMMQPRYDEAYAWSKVVAQNKTKPELARKMNEQAHQIEAKLSAADRAKAYKLADFYIKNYSGE